MMKRDIFEGVEKARKDLAELFQNTIALSMSVVDMEMDEEIQREVRERVAVLLLDEMVNDMPVAPYLAIWEDEADEIYHAFMSPRIETICGYSPEELMDVGFKNIVNGDVISFYRGQNVVEKKVNPISELREKRVAGFLESRHWDGCYQIKHKGGKRVWVIDRCAITRFRNTVRGNILCLSGGILLETTELFHQREKKGDNAVTRYCESM